MDIFQSLFSQSGGHPGPEARQCLLAGRTEDYYRTGFGSVAGGQFLKQVLDNAFKFADPSSPRVELRAGSESGRAKISVWDNGRGVPPEQRDRLFAKLTQLDREVHEQQGSGLGLYIASRLLEINGGTIRVGDSPEGGMLVEIELPASGVDGQR